MLLAINVFGFNTNPMKDLTSCEITNCDNVTVVLKTRKGKTIHQEIIANCKELPEDIEWSELEDGTYKLEYDLGMEIKVVPVSIVNSNVEFKAAYKVFVPVVNRRGDLVYITKLAFENQNMKISIYDSSDDLVYTESFKDSNLQGRIFDFSKIRNEEFKVVVKADGRTYTKTILM